MMLSTSSSSLRQTVVRRRCCVVLRRAASSGDTSTSTSTPPAAQASSTRASATTPLPHDAFGLGGTRAAAAKMAARGNLPTRRPIVGVKHIVAVASGKGGVGKSTVAGDFIRALLVVCVYICVRLCAVVGRRELVRRDAQFFVVVRRWFSTMRARV